MPGAPCLPDASQTPPRRLPDASQAKGAGLGGVTCTEPAGSRSRCAGHQPISPWLPAAAMRRLHVAHLEPPVCSTAHLLVSCVRCLAPAGHRGRLTGLQPGVGEALVLQVKLLPCCGGDTCVHPHAHPSQKPQLSCCRAARASPELGACGHLPAPRCLGLAGELGGCGFWSWCPMPALWNALMPRSSPELGQGHQDEGCPRQPALLKVSED